MGQTSAVGSFQLFLGKMLSTVVLAVGSIILTILISEADYGLYVVAIIPATTALLFQDWGIGSALIRYCASYRSTNQQEDLRKTIVAGFSFEIVTGLILTLILLSISGFMAVSVFNKPGSALPMALVSITVLSTAILGASQSILIGFEKMSLYTYVMICQAFFQCLISPTLVFLGYGTLGAVVGYTVASISGAAFSSILVYSQIFRRLTNVNTAKADILQTLKPMLGYGVPLAIAALLGGIMTQFYSFMVASYCGDVMIGNFGISNNFAVLLTFFAVPISTVLFPAFSKLNVHKEPQLLKTIFTSSVKYTAFLLVPATLAMMILSKQLIGTIYGDKWPYASFFLSLYAINYLFTIFGSLSNGSALTGLGETNILMKLNLLTIPIGIPLAFLLIPSFGIPAAIIVNILAGSPTIFLGLYWSWRHYGLKADLKSSAKILISSGIAAFTTYIFINYFQFAPWVLFSSGLVLFLAVYLVAAPRIGAINQADIDNLRAMFSNLGFVSKLLEIPLRIAERPLKRRS